MTIIGLMAVRNEERFIQANLRYHLAKHGFDAIIVVDNGSTDRTRERVLALKHQRVIYRAATGEEGFLHDRIFTATARSLFQQRQCDWLVPFDADEFWLSRSSGSLRRLLTHTAEEYPEIDGVTANVFQLHESELDDTSANHPLLRVRFAKPLDLPRAIAYRLGDRFDVYPFGAHGISLKGGEEPNLLPLDYSDLGRVHYNRCSVEVLRERLLNQVEGYILRFGTRWLNGHEKLAPRVLRLYQSIKRGTFEENYRKNSIFSKQAVEAKLERGELFELSEMPGLLRPYVMQDELSAGGD